MPETSLRRRYAWWIVGVGVLAISIAVVLAAGARPGYDPYGWLVWGYQSLHGSLNLGGAPSWKPLPLLFCVPYALFGRFALWLWMVTAVAVSFAGSVFAARIAHRIVSRDGRGGWIRAAAIAAALFAGLGMYGIQDTINGTPDSYLHYLLSAQSDPMIVTFVLAAIDLHMGGHRRWVLAMLGLASLGRPEVWPALGLYMAYVIRSHPPVRRPDLRRFVAVEVVAIAFLWFGVPWITNGRPFVAGDLAQGSPRELHANKLVGTIDRFTALNLWPVWVLALAAVAWAARRWWRARDPDAGLVLGLAALSVLWLAVEVAFALHGWPAVPRYIFPPAVVAILLASIGLGWLLRAAPALRAGNAPARLPGVLAGAALCACLIPGARARIGVEHRDLRHEQARTREIDRMASIIDALGGPRAVLRCGQPVTDVEYVSLLGWLTDLNDGVIGHRPQFELHRPTPVILFTALPNGWASYAWHMRRSQAAACGRAMNRVQVVTPGRPHGVTVTNRIPPRPDPPIPDTPLPG